VKVTSMFSNSDKSPEQRVNKFFIIANDIYLRTYVAWLSLLAAVINGLTRHSSDRILTLVTV
jgi:hypothetical protein